MLGIGWRFGGLQKEGFTVVVEGIEEMQKLKDLVDGLDYADTSVTVLKYADEEKAEALLIKKIIDKAKMRASVLAANSGLKVGDIIEITEINEYDDPMTNMMGMYSELLKLQQKKGSNENYTGSLSKGFRIKFIAK
ncbi:hypothetical protein GCM10007424_18330 [Flavobacterium suaedae]|uniref:Uncharacterized protein n=1 Tax=Flavobacterium suaedae TaxID=1767027 RepID=A0ABQ1JZG4_9FLAO|nr:SIMPL domain-containing protein [Flavobacterium suaedae]GGB78520.1 hypothetical protein GCM10007424_18330 [Flavobacterium suaedae]